MALQTFFCGIEKPKKNEEKLMFLPISGLNKSNVLTSYYLLLKADFSLNLHIKSLFGCHSSFQTTTDKPWVDLYNSEEVILDNYHAR